jgi:DNA-damage-inducible protein J
MVYNILVKGGNEMAQVNIRIDDTLKARGDELFNSLGLSFSAAVGAFVSQAVREGGMPFLLTTKTDPFYSESNMKVLRQSIQDANSGKLTAHELIEQ